MKSCYLAMIKAFPGGWAAMAGALGMTHQSLENRIYERKGQTLHAETAMQMQSFSGTTLYAEAVAKASGGVFVTLPESKTFRNQELLRKFNELHTELGELSAKFNDYTIDDEINNKEREDLMDVGQHIHRTVIELLALTFKVYCPAESGNKDES